MNKSFEVSLNRGSDGEGDIYFSDLFNLFGSTLYMYVEGLISSFSYHKYD